MFGIGMQEMVIILVIALIVFGPKKLPDIGRSVGNAMREFKKAQADFMDAVNTASHEDDDRPPVKTIEYPTAMADADDVDTHVPGPYDAEYHQVHDTPHDESYAYDHAHAITDGNGHTAPEAPAESSSVVHPTGTVARPSGSEREA